MKYSNYISVSEQFKNSVNIEYDLQTYRKLSSYIPTEDVCEILRYFFNSIEDNKYNRSTFLEGPYGKGKSYLVLTLLQLLQLDLSDENVKVFLEKLREVDISLYNQYLKLKSKGIKLLPVIINSNYSHLPQALNMALKEALEKIGLNHLFPNTAYEVSLSVIEQWKNDGEIDKKVISKCLEKTGSSLENLERGIKDYNINSFNKFVELYNCIVKGLSFNPFTSDDVVKNYSDIAYKLSKYGYTGVFIVFDEFSKFIETENEKMSADLKVLQDLAEMVNRSGKIGQMHLCCITHKSLSSYYKNQKEIIVNSFRTVEGRFKEILFYRSLNQNYQIISMTLIKNKDYQKFFDYFYKENYNFYQSISNYEIFKEVNHEILMKGCFPLNPLTTFSLVHISEKVAQNERTLFTFISDTDADSLLSFIKNNENGLFNVDKVYDYFGNLFEKSDEEAIRKISYKAKICLTKVDDLLEKRIFKVLAIIKIIDDSNYVPTLEMIASSLNVTDAEVLIKLNNLVDNKLIKKSFATEYYDFALASSKIIDAKVDNFLASKMRMDNVSSALNSIFDSEFVLPRKYNAKHKMTRFYRKKYIADFELLNLKSFDFFFRNDFSDGFIFNVINTIGGENEEIINHFYQMGMNETVILQFTNKKFDKVLVNEVFRIKALQVLLLENNIDEIVKDETKLIISDEINELDHILTDIYSTKNIRIVSKYDESNYSERLSETMENVYSCTPIINNEMINKENGVSSQYIKPRNIVANLYLKKAIKTHQVTLDGFSATSPESTVFNSIKETTSFEKRMVLDEIKKYLTNCEGIKQPATAIVDILRKPPFGIRSGVMPLLICMAISELDDNILFYFDKKEIDLTAENINKMIDRSDKYYFVLEKGSIEKDKYLNTLLDIFELKTTNCYRDDIKLCVSYIQKWIMSQPRIIRSQTLNNNYLSIEENFINLKNIFTGFNINEYEALFVKLPSIFNGEYNLILNSIKYYKNEINNIITEFSKHLSEKVKQLFAADTKSSLISIFEDWIFETHADQKILTDKEKTFITLFNNKDYDDISMINLISKNIVHLKIADWERDYSNEILDFIQNIRDNIEDRSSSSDLVKKLPFLEQTIDENDISVIGNMLLNNVEEVFEEFADSVSNEEKIKILTKLIKEMI